MAIMYITHNLGVVAQMAENVVVMYMGKIVEQADMGDLPQATASVRRRCCIPSRVWEPTAGGDASPPSEGWYLIPTRSPEVVRFTRGAVT